VFGRRSIDCLCFFLALAVNDHEFILENISYCLETEFELCLDRW
jgi:hypothetical protein